MPGGFQMHDRHGSIRAWRGPVPLTLLEREAHEQAKVAAFREQLDMLPPAETPVIHFNRARPGV